MSGRKRSIIDAWWDKEDQWREFWTGSRWIRDRRDLSVKYRPVTKGEYKGGVSYSARDKNSEIQHCVINEDRRLGTDRRIENIGPPDRRRI